MNKTVLQIIHCDIQINYWKFVAKFIQGQLPCLGFLHYLYVMRLVDRYHFLILSDLCNYLPVNYNLFWFLCGNALNYIIYNRIRISFVKSVCTINMNLYVTLSFISCIHFYMTSMFRHFSDFKLMLSLEVARTT